MTDEEIRVLRQIKRECAGRKECNDCRYDSGAYCSFAGTPASWILKTDEDRKAEEVLKSFSEYCNDRLCSNCYIRSACWKMYNTIKFKTEHPNGVEG